MKKEILALIIERGEVRPIEIQKILNVSRQIIHRHLSNLIEEGKIIKLGTPPKVYYQAVKNTAISSSDYDFLDNDLKLLNDTFIEITPQGRLLTSKDAFEYWCKKRKLPVGKTLVEYTKTLEKYKTYKTGQYIEGDTKLKSTKGFSQICIEKLFYLDFYAIERFGKTKLGKLMHYGKQSQNRTLINQIVTYSKPKILKLIEELNIEAIGYIPPTIKRELQIMNILEEGFDIPKPHLKIVKVKGDIIVPQKSLSKIYDRIENTRASIMIEKKHSYSNVLFIDDAVRLRCYYE